MQSILTTTKKMLGIDQSHTYFDDVLIMHINSVFMVLTQLGVGPPTGFSIKSDDEEWDDFIANGSNLEAVKTYVYQKVRLVFDPPTSSALIEAMNRSINEFEWRLNVASENQNGA